MGRAAVRRNPIGLWGRGPAARVARGGQGGNMRGQVERGDGWEPGSAVNRTEAVRPWKSQLLKWVGTKQRYAHEIVSHFPKTFDLT